MGIRQFIGMQLSKSGVGVSSIPVVTSATTSSSTVVRIVFSKSVTPTTAGWSFKKNGVSLALSSVANAGPITWDFTVASMSAGDIITVSYDSVTGNTLDTSNNELVSFTDRSVSNTISGGTDADATAFLTATGITDTTISSAINSLVINLKAGGVWDRSIAIYPFVGGTSTTLKYNLKDPRDLDAAFRLSFQGTSTFANTGWKPNGTTGYAKTFINPNIHVPPYSFHFSYYNRTPGNPGASDYFLFGGKGAGAEQLSLEFYSTNRMNGIVGDSSKQLLINPASNFDRLVVMTCYHDNIFKIFRDNSSIGSQTGSRVSYFENTDPNSTAGYLYLGALNNAETAQYFSSFESGFASFGYGLNDTQVASLNTAVNNFQTTLGRAV